MTRPTMALLAVAVVATSTLVSAATTRLAMRPRYTDADATWQAGYRQPRPLGKATLPPVDFAARFDGPERWLASREFIATGRGQPGRLTCRRAGWGGPLEQTHPADRPPPTGPRYATEADVALCELTSGYEDAAGIWHDEGARLVFFRDRLEVWADDERIGVVP